MSWWNGPSPWEDHHTQLYRHWAADGTLLYVGISLSAVQRLAGHRGHSSWFGQIATITVQHFGTRSEALSAEYTAIATEAPKYNVVGTTGKGYQHDSPDPRWADADMIPQREVCRRLGTSRVQLWREIKRKDMFPPVIHHRQGNKGSWWRAADIAMVLAAEESNGRLMLTWTEDGSMVTLESRA